MNIVLKTFEKYDIQKRLQKIDLDNFTFMELINLKTILLEAKNVIEYGVHAYYKDNVTVYDMLQDYYNFNRHGNIITDYENNIFSSYRKLQSYINTSLDEMSEQTIVSFIQDGLLTKHKKRILNYYIFIGRIPDWKEKIISEMNNYDKIVKELNNYNNPGYFSDEKTKRLNEFFGIDKVKSQDDVIYVGIPETNANTVIVLREIEHVSSIPTVVKEEYEFVDFSVNKSSGSYYEADNPPKEYREIFENTYPEFFV